MPNIFEICQQVFGWLSALPVRPRRFPYCVKRRPRFCGPEDPPRRNLVTDQLGSIYWGRGSLQHPFDGPRPLDLLSPQAFDRGAHFTSPHHQPTRKSSGQAAHSTLWSKIPGREGSNSSSTPDRAPSLRFPGMDPDR